MISKDWVAVFPYSHFSHLSSSFSGWKNCRKLRSTVHVSSSESSLTSTDRWRYISSLDLFRLQEEDIVPIKYVPVIQRGRCISGRWAYLEYPHESHWRQTRTLSWKYLSVGSNATRSFCTMLVDAQRWSPTVPFSSSATTFPSASFGVSFSLGDDTLPPIVDALDAATTAAASGGVGLAANSSCKKSTRSDRNSWESRCSYLNHGET